MALPSRSVLIESALPSLIVSHSLFELFDQLFSIHSKVEVCNFVGSDLQVAQSQVNLLQ